MAFGFNLSNYFFILSTSPLTTTISSNGVKVVILVISAIQDKVGAPKQWCGVALASVSIMLYAYFSYASRGRPPPPLWPPFAKAPEPESDPEAMKVKMLNESTPLKGDSDSPSCCTIS